MAAKKSQEASNSNKENEKINPTEKKTSCCGTPYSCNTLSASSGSPSSLTMSHPQSPESQKGPKTRIKIKYDVGFKNAIYLRGKGANLSWEKGVCLKNTKADEWIWETEIPFSTGEFKVLINDKQYETGQNHCLTCGAIIEYTPHF